MLHLAPPLISVIHSCTGIATKADELIDLSENTAVLRYDPTIEMNRNFEGLGGRGREPLI